jgi:hypothetical protein
MYPRTTSIFKINDCLPFTNDTMKRIEELERKVKDLEEFQRFQLEMKQMGKKKSSLELCNDHFNSIDFQSIKNKKK